MSEFGNSLPGDDTASSGIGPGDEVITTAYTYTASASVVEHVGAKLVLVDVAKDSYEIDYEKLADAITEKTKRLSR